MAVVEKRIYHVLPEGEPFSAISGGAISRWVANVLRVDASACVVCPTQDGTWGFEGERVMVNPRLASYSRLRRVLKNTARPANRAFLRYVFARLTVKANPGDVWWIHNRPECAAALAPSAALRGVGLVLHMHNSHLLSVAATEARIIAESLVVFCSDFLRTESMQKWPFLTNNTVLYNGADDSVFFPQEGQRASNDRTLVLLFVGRLVEDKGAHVLVEAASKLRDIGVNVLVRIVGSSRFGAMKRTLYERELILRASPNVRFLGYLSGDALVKEFRKADVFCCPSVWNDPQPLSILEAMASGLPVVASRVGGIPEMLRHGGGILVEPNNSAALSQAVLNLIDNPGLLSQLASEARVVFEQNYRWGHINGTYKTVIANLCGAAPLNE